MNASNFSQKITHLGDALSAPCTVEWCKTGRGPLSQDPRPGDITRRIGPSVPSPSLPVRSYSVAPPARRIGPWALVDLGFFSISRLARTTSVLEYARSLQGRYVYPLGYAL